jgi:iron complex transport system substrate-binding protein
VNQVTFTLLLLLVGLTGCTERKSSVVDSVPSPASGQLANENWVIDRLGRKVQLSKAPQRLVSLSPATTELLFAIEAGNLLVGSTEYCDYPEAAKAIPRVGSGPMGTISLEAIVQKQPDLVLCKFDTHQPLIESLQRLNIHVLAIGPESLDQLYEEAQWLGALLDRESQSQRLVAGMRGRVAELTSRLDSENPRRKVFYQVWSDPLMSAGPGSFIDELLRLAGLINIVPQTLGRYPRINPELLTQANPDLILLPSSTSAEQDRLNILQRPAWQSVPAVAQRRVHLISGDVVSRCGPRMLDALEQMIQLAGAEDSQ